MTMNDLNTIAEAIREEMNAINDARDKAIVQSRDLIRHCAECIRAIHRREWNDVSDKLSVVQTKSDELRAVVADYPELYHSGYTQDALKEVVEAHITLAIIRDEPLPSAADLAVEGSTYLKGLGEAATELRRFILDIMRHSERHSDEAERLLDWMDDIYGQLITFDFPDALTHGLRRQTDVVRSVLERTRGDMTSSLRQQQLQDALSQLERRLSDDDAEPVNFTMTPEVRTALMDLHTELDEMEFNGDASLEQISARVLSTRNRLDAEDDQRNLLAQLRTEIEAFEAEHPVLTARINTLIQALSNAGI